MIKEITYILFALTSAFAIDLSFYEDFEQTDSTTEAIQVNEKPSKTSWFKYANNAELYLGIEKYNDNKDDFYSKHLEVTTSSLFGNIWIRNLTTLSATFKKSVVIFNSEFLFGGIYKDYSGESGKWKYWGKINELYLDISRTNSPNMNLFGGIKKLQPGPGLSYHPAFQLPIKRWQFNYQDNHYQQVTPLIVGGEIFFMKDNVFSLHFFPEVKVDSLQFASFTSKSQNTAIEASLSFSVGDIAFISLAGYRQEHTSLELSSEFVFGGWQIFSEAVISHEKKQNSILRSMSSQPESMDNVFLLGDSYYYWKDVEQNFIPELLLGIQYDFNIGVRFSYEFIYNGIGLSPEKISSNATILKKVNSIKKNELYYPATLAFWSSVDEHWSIEDIYRYHSFLRISNITTNRFQFALNTVLYYPFDAMIQSLELSYRLLDRFNLDILINKKWLFKDESIMNHMPLDFYTRAGITINL